MAAEVNESYLRPLYAMALEVKIYYPLCVTTFFKFYDFVNIKIIIT